LFIHAAPAAVVAAMAHQYSLIPRVALFMKPLFALLVGYGFELLMRIRFSLWRGALVLFCYCLCKYHNSASKMITDPFVSEEIRHGLKFSSSKIYRR